MGENNMPITPPCYYNHGEVLIMSQCINTLIRFSSVKHGMSVIYMFSLLLYCSFPLLLLTANSTHFVFNSHHNGPSRSATSLLKHPSWLYTLCVLQIVNNNIVIHYEKTNTNITTTFILRDLYCYWYICKLQENFYKAFLLPPTSPNIGKNGGGGCGQQFGHLQCHL